MFLPALTVSLRSYLGLSPAPAPAAAAPPDLPHAAGTAFRFLPDSRRSPVSWADSRSFSRESVRPTPTQAEDDGEDEEDGEKKWCSGDDGDGSAAAGGGARLSGFLRRDPLPERSGEAAEEEEDGSSAEAEAADGMPGAKATV